MLRSCLQRCAPRYPPPLWPPRLQCGRLARMAQRPEDLARSRHGGQGMYIGRNRFSTQIKNEALVYTPTPRALTREHYESARG